jgi:predicted glycogen debranching enzyme
LITNPQRTLRVHNFRWSTPRLGTALAAGGAQNIKLMQFDLSREWLETNGLGGFACGTVIGANTRRYHALLCAATKPPRARMVLVNKIDETLIVDGKNFELGCNQFPDAIAPRGYEFLCDFSCDPLPQWNYVLPAEATGLAQEITLKKQVWMPHGYNQTLLRYSLAAPEDVSVELRARAFITGRDYHSLRKSSEAFDTRLTFKTNEAGGAEISLRPDAQCPPITFACDGMFQADGIWYYNFIYERETERGLDDREDMFTPGEFAWRLQNNQSALLSLASEPLHLRNQEKPATRLFVDGEAQRRTALTSAFADSGREYSQSALRLVRAADQFLVRREDDLRYTIIAGYPWFSDWGRDTMIALPGLCLATGRIYAAASILLNFASHVSEGMIPNRFPDAGQEPEYNTFDATLWFSHATAEYYKKTGDWKTTRQIYFSLRKCLKHHLEGTRFGIIADESDGLLRGGHNGSTPGGSTQLTWMDAKDGDHAFTPRAGKPVEIQALWYKMLRDLAEFAALDEDRETNLLCRKWGEKVRANFAAEFWNEDEKCLFDCIDDAGNKDAAIRPNQLFAVSLFEKSELLSREQEYAVVEVATRELLTPVGLRTLSPHDPNYRGRYEGSQWQRDGAYHQGTVWPWLMGAFLSAHLKVHDRSDAAKTQAREWLEPLLNQLDAACRNSINEIYDGDAPHTPRGCFAQAWSVGEVLRVLVEEIKHA